MSKLHKCYSKSCGKMLPASEFYKNRSKKRGLGDQCKSCTNAYVAEYDNRNCLYQQMAVYVVTNKLTLEQYVGSTTTSLQKRLNAHWSRAMTNNSNQHIHHAMRTFNEKDMWHIEPLEVYGYDEIDLSYLREREQHYIDEMGPVLNEVAASRETKYE